MEALLWLRRLRRRPRHMWAAAASSCSLQVPPRRYIAQLPPPPSAMAFTGYIRWASSLGRRQSRWARIAREPVRESLLTLACEDDAELVSRFATAARQELGDLVLHDAAHEPLASLCTQSAQGTLPCTAWRAEFARLPAIHAPEPCSEERGAQSTASWRKERWTALMTHLRAQLPPDAHETRLRAALQLVPSSDAAHASGTAEATVAADDHAVAETTVDDHDPAAVADANAALVMLMEGALKITAGGAHAQLPSPPQLETPPARAEVPSPLQLELLARLRRLSAEGGLGCDHTMHAHDACTSCVGALHDGSFECLGPLVHVCRGTRAAASHATRPQPLRVPNRLAGLVQAPLLCRLGAPEAARLPRLQLGPELDGARSELDEHRGELERDRDELEGDWGELECLLAAAELARRG